MAEGKQLLSQAEPEKQPRAGFVRYAEAKHLILDIETLGVKKPAVIASIGAVVWGFRTGVVAKFKAAVDVKGFAAPPEIDSVLWWLRQSPAAIRHTFGGAKRVPVADALSRFFAFCREHSPDYYWGNSPDFDFGHLEAYAGSPADIPWKFSQLRDIRTFCCEDLVTLEDKREILRNRVQHDALEDAKAEAEFLAKALERLTGERAFSRREPPGPLSQSEAEEQSEEN